MSGRRWALYGLLLAAVAGAAYRLVAPGARTPDSADPLAAGAGGDAVPLVEVARLTLGPVRRKLPLSGVLRAEQEVTLSAALPGRLAEVYVREGARVRAGQPIARVAAPELSAQVEQALAGVAAARSKLIQAEKGLPLQEVTRETEIRQAEEGVAAARARLLQAEEAARMASAEADADVLRGEAALEAARARLAAARKGARPEQVRQAEAQVTQARAAHVAARSALERAQFLHDRGGLPRAQLEAARAAAESAEAQLESAEQQLALVKAGMAAEELRAVEQQVREAEAGLAAAKAGSRRKGVAARDVEAARTQLRQAEAALVAARASRGQAAVQREDVAAARAMLRQAEAAARTAAAQLRTATITTPVAGVVARLSAEAGETVMPGTPIATIVSLAGVTFEATVSPRDRELIAPGMRVRVHAAADRRRWVPGRVREVLPVAEADNRSFRICVALEQRGGWLTPGAYATAEVELYRDRQALLVPQEALVGQEDAWYVFRVVKGRVQRRSVRVGAGSEGKLEVLSGLRPGDEVVLSPGASLGDGDRVRTVPRGSGPAPEAGSNEPW